MAMLQVENLSLAYEKLPIIDSLTVAAPSGLITALIGPNGCGKSTLLRGMARLLKPKQGAIFLDGQAIHSIPTRQLARQLGILAQAPVAPDGITVRELVAQGRYPHQSWFQQWGSQDEAALILALEQTKLTQLIDRPVDTLSGGQRQRAWIAMALAQETPVLLLDEPTTYLDMAHQMEVLDLLRTLNEHGSRTIIMAIHDLNHASQYAHHTILLSHGRIIAEGSPASVITEAHLQAVFGIECRIIHHPVFGTPLCLPLGAARSR